MLWRGIRISLQWNGQLNYVTISWNDLYKFYFNGYFLFWRHLSLIVLGIKLPVASCKYINLCSESPLERSCIISMYLAYKKRCRRYPPVYCRSCQKSFRNDHKEQLQKTPLFLSFICNINFLFFWWWAVDTWKKPNFIY